MDPQEEYRCEGHQARSENVGLGKLGEPSLTFGTFHRNLYLTFGTDGPSAGQERGFREMEFAGRT